MGRFRCLPHAGLFAADPPFAVPWGVGFRALVLTALAAGCATTTSSVGLGTTTSSDGGTDVTVALSSSMGMRFGEHVDLGLTSNLSLANWGRAGDAYGALNDWAASGAVDCCSAGGPFLTMFKYMFIGVGYASAWVVATNMALSGVRLRYWVQRYAPTLYVEAGAGPAIFTDEDGGEAFGIGVTGAVGYMFAPTWGLEARTSWGNANAPEWATFSVGLVLKPRKRFFGLFGGNELERPPPPPPPPPAYQGPPGAAPATL